MRTRTVAVGCALALLASGCGSRLSDDQLAAGAGTGGGGPAATTPGGSTPDGAAASGDMFGSLESPCGGAPEGFVPTASDQGVTEDTIKLAVISDITGFIKVPTASVAESTQAFVKYCNDLGGINGRQLELQLFDSKIVEQREATLAACDAGVFAIVGSGSVQDQMGAQDMIDCGLVEVPAYTATAAKAMSDNLVQPLPNPTTAFNVGPARYVAEQYPDAVKKAAMLSSDIETATVQADRVIEAYEAHGFEFIYRANTPAFGVESYATYIQEMKNNGVEYFTMVSATAETVKVLRDMETQGFEPAVIDLGAQYYDPELLAEPGSEGALVLANTALFEEAEESEALSLYLEAYDEVDTEIEPALLGVQSFSAALLFATAAKAAGADLTRDRLLEELHKITEWDGGGLHMPGNPGANEVGRCFAYVQVQGGNFVRLTPTEPLAYTCDDDFAFPLEGSYGEGAKLGGP